MIFYHHFAMHQIRNNSRLIIYRVKYRLQNADLDLKIGKIFENENLLD